MFNKQDNDVWHSIQFELRMHFNVLSIPTSKLKIPWLNYTVKNNNYYFTENNCDFFSFIQNFLLRINRGLDVNVLLKIIKFEISCGDKCLL